MHLDELPIDYDERVAPERFLAGLAFMLARNRYDCAESMIGSGFGATVMGAIARSVLVDGLRWLWIAHDRDRLGCILGDLMDERSRVASLLGSRSCPTLTRFLIPVPPVADLTGAARAWVDAPSLPDEDALLDQLFAATIGLRARSLETLATLPRSWSRPIRCSILQVSAGRRWFSRTLTTATTWDSDPL